MPLDPSIYNSVGRANLGQGLSDLLNQQRERESVAEQRQLSLANLAMQKEDRQKQLMQKQSQDFNMWLSGAVQSGRPQEEIMRDAIAKGNEIGIPQDSVSRHVSNVFASSQTPQTRSDLAFTQAYPDIVAKQRAESMFGKGQSPISWNTVETEKGIVQVNPQTGEVRPLGINQPKKTTAMEGGQRGQIIFDNQGNAYNVNPYTNEVQPVIVGGKQIQGAQFAPGLQGQISGARAFGSETGKATGEATVNLQDIESQMPNLEKLVTDLSAIGKKATYTKTGQIADIARRQLGMDVGEGAVARKEYISKVDNEILPLLRQTFGAAFTAKEGESLRATLGDPDASPEEKDAVLRSFIQTKKAQVGSLKRRTGTTTATSPVQGGAKFLGFE